MLIGLAIADDQIRPAQQTDSRGVGEQIRPANQQSLPSDGNGGYSPSQGSSYSSGYSSSSPSVDETVKMKTVLNSTNLSNSNATGTADILLNKTDNTLTYNITLSGLSSNETSTSITIPWLIINNQTVSIPLPLGEMKQGVISYISEIESYLLNGNAFLKVRSLLFPEGEIGGEIKII